MTLLTAALFVLAPSFFAQDAGDAAPSGPLSAWQARHGAGWRVIEDGETGFARSLFGGSSPAPFAPRADGDYLALARLAVEGAQPLFGIDPATLVEDGVTFLPLGMANSSDKTTVQLRQEIGGVPVVRGYVTVLFDLEGNLLSIDATCLPRLEGFETRPVLSPAEAIGIAAGAFARDTGLPPEQASEPLLVIDQVSGGGRRGPRLAWEVRLDWSQSGFEPEGWIYRIGARDGALVAREQAIHRCDVSGTVRSLVSPGTQPDTPSAPEVEAPMPHMFVTSSAGNVVTDGEGNFTLAGASPPVDVTVTYEGSFCDVVDDAGGDHVTSAVLTEESGNVVLMNSLAAPMDTAEANAYDWINRLRDWTRATNPADATADFQALAIVNLPAACNAFWNGVAVHFFLDTVICVNSAYSTVVVHEMGHWLNQRYGSGNGPDGFGEGNADVFAMYVADDPIVGRNFCGNGCHIRNGNNTRQFCGDCCGGCHGGVHANGEVLMGALWKVRANLKSSLGSQPGGAAADALFNAWMNAYNDGQIKSIIETHWLVLDDDDGNLANGTPNYPAIDAGFRAQGFPGFDLPCAGAANYCTATTTSQGTLPAIGWTGSPTLAANDFAVTLQNAVPNKNAILFHGAEAHAAPFQGGTLCARPPLVRSPVFQIDPFGFASRPVPITAAMVGETRFYQFYFRDPQAPQPVGLSDGLRVQFCLD